MIQMCAMRLSGCMCVCVLCSTGTVGCPCTCDHIARTHTCTHTCARAHTHTHTHTHTTRTHTTHLYEINEVLEGSVEVCLFTETNDVTKVGVVNVGVNPEETL